MSLFSIRVSKTEAAVAVAYLALVIAYLQYEAQSRQASAQRSTSIELRRLNLHIEELRGQEGTDEFELPDGRPCHACQ